MKYFMNIRIFIVDSILRPLIALLDRLILVLTDRFCIVQLDRDHLIRCNLHSGEATMIRVIRDLYDQPAHLELLPVIQPDPLPLAESKFCKRDAVGRFLLFAQPVEDSAGIEQAERACNHDAM
jgi:hypothetical protein